MRVIYDCPLGMECEHQGEIGGEKIIRRCAWYTKVVGKDPQSEKEIDHWGCAMAFMPVIMLENNQAVSGLQAATESARNESVNIGQSVAGGLLALAQTIKNKQLEVKNGD